MLVNEQFQEIDRFEGSCSLKPGLIPEPGALLVNHTTAQMLKKNNLSHYNLIKEFEKKIREWMPAIFIGYNSISFDEEFLRNTLFKLLKNPYITQLGGNKRGDLLNIARSANLFFKDSIKTTFNSKGNAVFRLDQLAPENGIIIEKYGMKAHDALGDVLATVKLGELIENNAKEVWNSSLKTTSKSDVDKIIQNEKIFLINEFYGKARAYTVTFVCNHPVYNWPQCFDLKNNPLDYLSLTTKELSIAMKKSPKIVRSVKNNKHPILMNYNHFDKIDEYKEIGMEELMKRARMVREDENFATNVSLILEQEAEEKKYIENQEDLLAEESIYSGGFSSSFDKKIMQEFHSAGWEERMSIADKFKDQRFFYFAMRLIYEESPQSLPKDIYREIHRSIAKQILSIENEKWNTIPKAYQELDNLRENSERREDNNFLTLLSSLDDFFQEIERNYENA